MKLLTFEQIKQMIDGFSLTPEIKDRNDIRLVAQQLGYTVPNCTCKDKFADLVVKLKLWLRQHPTDFCHYAMKAGVVRKGSKGTNVYNLNLTDEEAVWLLENDPEAKSYITKIIKDENVIVEPTVTEDVTEDAEAVTEGAEQELESAKNGPAKKPARKRSQKVKK